MRDALGVHRVDEGEVIGVAGHFREQLAAPATRPAVLGVFPERFHDALVGLLALAGVGDLAGVIETHELAVLLGQQWLVIE